MTVDTLFIVLSVVLGLISLWALVTAVMIAREHDEEAVEIAGEGWEGPDLTEDWLEEVAETDDVIREIKDAVEAQHPEWRAGRLSTKPPSEQRIPVMSTRLDDIKGFEGTGFYEEVEKRLLQGYQWRQPTGDEPGVRKWAHEYEKARQEAVLRQQDIQDEARRRQRKLQCTRKQPLLPCAHEFHLRWPCSDQELEAIGDEGPFTIADVAAIRDAQRRFQEGLYLTPADIKNMSMEDYRKYRAALLSMTMDVN